MKEFRVMTDRGPMLIIATSQMDAEKIAIQDGHIVEVIVKVQLLDKEQVWVHDQWYSVRYQGEASGAMIFMMDGHSLRFFKARVMPGRQLQLHEPVSNQEW